MEDATAYCNMWATADIWCQTLIRYNSARKGHTKQVTMKIFTTAMNKVTAFVGYSEMRDYNVGNMHGVYTNQYKFTKRRAVYSYFTTGVPNQRCPILPTHNTFKTVDITNIGASARVEANTTAGNNPTGPSERTETSPSSSHPNDQHHSTSPPNLSASTPNPSVSTLNPSTSLTT